MTEEKRPTSSLFIPLLLALAVSFLVNSYLLKKLGTPREKLQQQTPPPPAPSFAAAMDTTGMKSAEQARGEIKRLTSIIKQYPDSDIAAWSQFRIAFLQETVLKDYNRAKQSYEEFSRNRQLMRTTYAATAAFRRAELIYATSKQEGKKEFEKLERFHLVDQSKVKPAPLLSPAWFAGLFRTPPQSRVVLPGGKEYPVMDAVCTRIEPLNSQEPLYKLLDIFVGIMGRNPHFSYGLAIILFGVIVKLLLQPLNTAAFRSMREMQKIQPEIKKIQEKYKGDKANLQKMNQEIMALYKAHGVNPMGGCLPLLIQLPILIFLYRAIMSYRCQFNQADFLWIKNLALPDMPLLLLYGVSMIISTKLTSMPSADPAQQQQQKMMTWLMPIMFIIICRNFPAAFVLYWMTFNFMQTAQQIALYRKMDREEGKEATGGLFGRIKTLSPQTTASPAASEGGAAEAAKDKPKLRPSNTYGAGSSLSAGQRRKRRKKKG